jgi:hypothetical protein
MPAAGATNEVDLDAARSARTRPAIDVRHGGGAWLERFETMARSTNGGCGPWRATATTSTATCFLRWDDGKSRRSPSTTSPA